MTTHSPKKTGVLSFLVVVLDFDGKCVVVAHFTTIHKTSKYIKDIGKVI
jgi:hypothetical protein